MPRKHCPLGLRNVQYIRRGRCMKVLLLTPPMTQINTPYPATAYLTGFLRQNGHDAVQADPALELFLRLVSAAGLKDILAELQKPSKKRPLRNASVRAFLENSTRYIETVDAVVRFLQGRDP